MDNLDKIIVIYASFNLLQLLLVLEVDVDIYSMKNALRNDIRFVG